MSLFEEPVLHDFPDRAIRKLLENPQNLRDTLMVAAPDMAPRFDYTQVELLPRSFLMEDWRRRESDLLFRIPYRTGDTEQPALVCVLLEHQSTPDPRMPLRLLIYAVLYWEQEWKAWEENHSPGQPLRLTPVLPLVFHTGSQPWRDFNSLEDLISGPPELRPFVPEWRPLFWDLAEQTPQDLLDQPGAWIQALAVVRAEREDTRSFENVFVQVLQHLETLGEEESIRRHDLLWFVLSWVLRRRPGREREQLIATAQAIQAERGDPQEVHRMTEMIEQSWEQWAEEHYTRLGLERGREVGREEGREVGREEGREVGREEGREVGREEGVLLSSRENLRLVLEERFGSVPEDVIRRIDETRDLQRLKDALRQVLRIDRIEDLEL